MELKSLSASSGQMFEDCPARWNAEYHGKAEQIGGAPAKKGTVVHATCEEWVVNGFHKDPPERPEQAIELMYSGHYEKYFADTSEYDDGLEMVFTWLHRTDWGGRAVLSTEVKKNFLITGPESGVTVPFNYIFDRCDEVDDPEERVLEVVDYKTWRIPMSAETLHHKIQAKSYALAASLEYPWADSVWVTMDQFRHDPVSVKYKKRELEEFHAYLCRLVDRIWFSDGSEEILNKDCRYCVRKLNCRALATNRDAGGTLGTLDDLVTAALLREKIEYRMNGLKTLLGEIDEFVLEDMKRRDEVELTLANPQNDAQVVDIALNISKRREISAERAAKVVGPDIIVRYGKLGIGVVDKLLKKDSIEISEQQKLDLAKLITVKWGDDPTASVTVRDL